MAEEITDLIRQWDGMGVVVSHDHGTDTWMFICLHDSRLGPCTGGTRMKVYPSRLDALRDGQRLAGAMTRKWAAIDQPFGGGKAVLALGQPLEGADRRALLRRYGRLVETLGGAFLTGEDLGTSTDDLRIVAQETRGVQGFDPRTSEKVDPSPYTAKGVYCGIEAALENVFGEASAEGRSALVQGAGNVGMQLARLLRADGARILLSDIDEARVRQAASELEAEVVAPEAVYETPCDIYAPCAVGATVNAETVPRLACRIVAGSANNQLADEADAGALHQRGILYLPDYVLNAGGALSFSLMSQGQPAGEGLMVEMERIGRIVREILAEATEQDASPLEIAERRVERRLAAGRSQA